MCSDVFSPGSQGMPLSLMAEGAKRILALADLIDSACADITGNSSPRIRVVDIGGGLSANYHSDAVTPTFGEYAQALVTACPTLRNSKSKRTLLTEFGKAIIAKCGYIVSTVEDVLSNETQTGAFGVASLPQQVTAICHAGADLLLRTAYCGDKFMHRVALLSEELRLVSTAEQIDDSVYAIGTAAAAPVQAAASHAGTDSNEKSHLYSPEHRTNASVTLAGPLCFSGDNIVKNILFPTPRVGDVCVVLDAGANTISLFSKHCSRQAPAVYVFRAADCEVSLSGNAANDAQDGDNKREYRVVCIREKESEADVLKFWDFPLL